MQGQAEQQVAQEDTVVVEEGTVAVEEGTVVAVVEGVDTLGHPVVDIPLEEVGSLATWKKEYNIN